MAGNLKPSPEMLEARYVYIRGSSYGTSKPAGLFDGIAPDRTNSNMMYWQTSSHYVEFQLLDKAHLWKVGTTNLGISNPFTIRYKSESDGTYVNITNTITQNPTDSDNDTWVKTVFDLEPGYYRFSTTRRYDGEWFFEKILSHVYLIRNIDTNKQYTINSNEFVEVIDLSFNNVKVVGISPTTNLNMLSFTNSNDTIGSNFDIIMYSVSEETPSSSNIELNVNVFGRRESESPLISILGIETLNKIELTGSGDVRTVISFNNGITWKKYDGTSWVEVVDAGTGMTINEVNDLNANIFASEIVDTNSIKLKHSFDYDSTIENINIICNMLGEQVVADTSYYKYNYDMVNKTITFNILKNGIYSVNYLDTI